MDKVFCKFQKRSDKYWGSASPVTYETAASIIRQIREQFLAAEFQITDVSVNMPDNLGPGYIVKVLFDDIDELTFKVMFNEFIDSGIPSYWNRKL